MDDIERLENKIEGLDTQLKEVLTLLKSNPDYNKKGYIEKVSDLRKDVNILITKEKVRHAKVVTISAITMTLVAAIIWIADKIINFLMNK